MIVGLGMDIIEVERVAEKVSKGNGFKEKVFSPEEILFCEKAASCNQHFAARFAAKEAFLKATGEGLVLGHDLHLIEITHTDSGKPDLKLNGYYKEYASEKKWSKIHVSLSHIEAAACAVVIIES